MRETETQVHSTDVKVSGQPTFTRMSVVIPTYNRRDVLAKALAGYIGQSDPGTIHELLVVDDGSTDDTESVVRDYGERAPFKIRYFRQANKGPAAARNLGIRESTSSLILFTDSDIIPQPDLVRQHLEWHNRDPQINAAVLGYVTWSPELKPTPFMNWYGERAIFAYRLLRGKRQADFRFFYSCNVSLKTEYLRKCGQFDEDFKNAAYEDIELGYRLNKQGMKLLYNAQAFAYHHQFFSFEDACRKTASYSKGLPLFREKEAGEYYLDEDRKRSATLRFRVATWLEAVIGATIGRSRSLPDSRIPLPSIIYRCLYWHRVDSLTGRRLRSAEN